jgi:putative transposase
VNIGTLPIFIDKHGNILFSIIPMPRIPRVCAEGYLHHITQCGNNKEKTFFSDEDKRYYLDTLQRYKDKYKLKILAYCIMSNHIPQKVGRPKRKDK